MTNSVDSQAPYISKEGLNKSQNFYIGTLDGLDGIDRQTKIESDKAYREIVSRIVGITDDRLDSIGNGKLHMQRILLFFIIGLLSVQFIALVVLLVCNSLYSLKISDLVITTFIVSVFGETLAGIMCMINFSFASKEEIELIKILSTISDKFQKF